MSQEKRTALVMSHDDYPELSPLPHAVNDAEDMVVTLEELGFTVILGKNRERRAMEEVFITLSAYLLLWPQSAISIDTLSMPGQRRAWKRPPRISATSSGNNLDASKRDVAGFSDPVV